MTSQRRRSQRLSQTAARKSVKSRKSPQRLPPPLLSSFPVHSIAEVKRLPVPEYSAAARAEHRPADAAVVVSMLGVVMSLGEVQSFTSKAGWSGERCCLHLGDASGRYFPLTLWSDRLHWREALRPGDIALFKHVKLSRWRSVTSASTVWKSELTVIVQRRTAAAAAADEDANAPRGRRLLPNSAPDWLQQHVDALVRWVYSEQSGGFLYLLPSSTSRDPSHARVQEAPLLSPPAAALNPASMPWLRVSELLSSTLTSQCYRVRCRVSRIAFPSLPFFAPFAGLRVGDVPPLRTMASLVYRGCPHCSRELHADRNGVFRSVCPACVAHDESRVANSDEAVVSANFFYRPFHVFLRDDDGDGEDKEDDDGSQQQGGVWLSVHHAVALRLFANLPASLWAEPSPPAAPALSGTQRRSKRRRSGTRLQVDEGQRALDEAAEAEAEAADDGEALGALCCGRSEAEPLLAGMCFHPRCQWLSLLCALVAGGERDGTGTEEWEEADNSGKVYGASAQCEVTLFVEARLDMDDNDEMQGRRLALVGCSTAC